MNAPSREAPHPSSQASLERGDHDDYLRIADRHYSHDQLEMPRYTTPYPNAEEAARAGAVIGYVARVVERFTLDGDRPRILDVGCGRGWLTNLLSVFGTTEGIDPATGAVAMARRYFPAITFHQGTTADLLARGEFQPFDIVVSSEVIEHVPTSYKKAFLGDIRVALKHRGFCIVTTPRGEIFDSFRRATTWTLQPVEDWLTEKQLWDLASVCGFRVLDRTRTRFQRLGFISRIALSSKLRKLLDAIGLPSLRAGIEHHYSHYQVVLLQKTDTEPSA